MTDRQALAACVAFANEHCDGHFTVMKFTTNWRVSFDHHPLDHDEIQDMDSGSTFPRAVAAALASAAKVKP